MLSTSTMSARARTASSTSSSVCASTSIGRSGLRVARQRHGARDAAGQSDVIVLDEHRIEETDAMVGARRRRHGVLLQHAQRRRCLARVENRDPAAGGVDEPRARVAMPESR